jgi:hypothetical protein
MPEPELTAVTVNLLRGPGGRLIKLDRDWTTVTRLLQLMPSTSGRSACLNSLGLPWANSVGPTEYDAIGVRD